MREELSIVHVARSPVGGLFRHISDLATAQSAAGHSVGLICDATMGSPLEEARIDALGARLRLGVTRVPMPRALGPADLPAALGVVRRTGAMRPEVVHSHGAKGGVYGRLAATFERRSGHPVVAFYTPHGGSLHYGRNSIPGRVYFMAERALERVTDGLLHVSAYEAEVYREKVGMPRCPQHVVRNGLQPEEFEPIAPRPDAADFLYIGELRDLKGVDVFIEALALLERQGKSPRALIVGPATPKNARRYRELANAKVNTHRVTFLPPMPAREAFSMAQTIVLPSRAESLPYVVLEAAAAARPLIATRVGGIPEIFEGEAERLVQPGDPVALASHMREALAAPDRLIGEAVLRRNRVQQRFSLAAMAAEIEAIYRRSLAARYEFPRATALPEADFSV
jgi:glycosyltransferase involved in cell wall biosynthesis